MESKKSFVLYADFAETAHKLGDADAGKLFKMILDHANGEDTRYADNLLLEIAFGPIKLQMDRDAEKWQKTREARSEAGKKGGRPKKQSKANKANASFVKQSKANKAVTVTVTDTVTENVNAIKNKASSQSEITEYCLELGLTEADGVSTWEKWEGNGWINGKSKIKDWKATLRSWNAAGYMPSQKNPSLRQTSRTAPTKTTETLTPIESF